MGNLIYRIVGFLFLAAGVALFAFMMQVTYDTAAEWDRMLIRIGMPLSFLLPMVGALIAALGAVIVAHSFERTRQTRRLGR